MASYEFCCSEGHQTMIDAPLGQPPAEIDVVCGACGGAVRRVYGCAVVFSGSGFYVTDNRAVEVSDETGES